MGDEEGLGEDEDEDGLGEGEGEGESEEGYEDDEGYWDGINTIELGVGVSSVNVDYADPGLAGHPP